MTNLEYKISYRRHLPHIQPPGATLFITFRLVGSIPAAVQAKLLAEAQTNEKRLAQIADPLERARQAYEMQRRSFGRWDRFLDTNPAGPHWLRQPEIAQIVVEALHHRHGRVYDLDTFPSSSLASPAHSTYSKSPPSKSSAAIVPRNSAVITPYLSSKRRQPVPTRLFNLSVSLRVFSVISV